MFDKQAFFVCFSENNFVFRKIILYLCANKHHIMRIITKKRIAEFIEKHADAKIALEDWYSTTISADWTSFEDMKRFFRSVDAVGNKRYVFNIKGNSYRLIAIVRFDYKIVYIRFIGTHAEYDKIKDCSAV